MSGKGTSGFFRTIHRVRRRVSVPGVSLVPSCWPLAVRPTKPRHDPRRQPQVARKGRASSGRRTASAATTPAPRAGTASASGTVAMHHMQVRGYLTGDETRAITEFFRGR